MRAASGLDVAVGRTGLAGRPARPCRLRWCASRSTGSRGSDTCPRSSPTRRPVSRPSSIRVATSTSTSTRRGPPTFGSRTSSRPTSTTTTCPGVVSSRRSSGRRTSSAPAPASPTSTARRATATRSTSGRCGSRPWTRRATRRSTSATRSPTRRAGDEPFLLLTGGSLLVGSVGRTDLLGAENARPFAEAMYRSLHDVLLPHEDSVMVYPTHGAGSLCSTGIASTSWSTIGYERRHDPLLAPMEVEAFARALLSGQPTIPRYFARMRPINQAGPRLLGASVPAIEPLFGAGLERRAGSWRGRGRHPVARQARPPPRPGLAVDPGRAVVRDLARLGGRGRCADRPDRGRPGRSRRPGAPGDPDRLRDDRGLRRRRVRGLGAGPVVRSRTARRSTSTTWRRRCRRAVRWRRSSSTSASRTSSRPATCPARSTSGRASCPRSWTGCRTTARSPWSAPAATARASPRPCCGPAGSAGSRRSPAAPRTGKRTATRSTTAPAPTASTGPPRPPRPRTATTAERRRRAGAPGSRPVSRR